MTNKAKPSSRRDGALIEHVLRWAPFGAPPAEEIFVNFGLTPSQVAERVHHYLHEADARAQDIAVLQQALNILDRHITPGVINAEAEDVSHTAAVVDNHRWAARLAIAASQLAQGAQPRPVSTDLSWQLRARCRGRSTSIFFESEHLLGEARQASEVKAKMICGRCPVVLQCLVHALHRPEEHGIWGGATCSERASLLDSRDEMVTSHAETELV